MNFLKSQIETEDPHRGKQTFLRFPHNKNEKSSSATVVSGASQTHFHVATT